MPARLPLRLASACVFLLASATTGVGFAQNDAAESAAESSPQTAREPGLTVRLYSLAEKPDGVVRLSPYQAANADAVSLESRLPTATLADPEGGPATLVQVRGFLRVDQTGMHSFAVEASGPANVAVGIGPQVIRGDATEGTRRLVEGVHPVRIDALLSGPAETRRLDLLWKPPGAEAFEAIAAERLETEADITRLVAPGFKTLFQNLRPGDRAPLESVHPGWDLLTLHSGENLAPMVGSMAFLPDGRLVVGTLNPLQRSDESLPDIETKEPDKLYAFSGVDGDSAEGVTVEPIADGLAEPMGLCFFGGALYVSQRKEVTRLTDPDGDGFFDRHETVASGWEGWNYHQFTMGLVERGGKLYTALSTAMAPPRWEGMRVNSAPGGPLRGTLVEIDPADGTVRHLAGGLRTPNGLGLGPGGDLFYTDNQGTWMPANLLAKLAPGRFYGHFNNDNFVAEIAEHMPEGGSPSAFAGEPRVQPAVWLPHNEVSNSPTTPLLIEQGPYAGQMLVGELTAGGIRRVFLEDVDGTTQGAVFRFTQGLESGINRMVWGPDGSLYVGGIGASGNWAWRGTLRGLQRLRPNGASAFEMASVRATPDGFVIQYTRPIDPTFLADPSNFTLRQWRYEPAPSYGGPKIDDVALTVEAAVPGEDATSVRLVVPGAKPGHVVHLVADPTSVDGETIWSTEAWYTLNAKPIAGAPARVSLNERSFPAGPVGVGAAPPAGAVTLLGRGHLASWQRGDARRPSGNFTQDELKTLPNDAEMIPAGGDLVTRTLYGDARFHVEFLSPSGGISQLGGNSGVYVQGLYELQVLNTPAGEAIPELDEAGALYNFRRPDVNASLGPDVWQSYDIWFKAARFENGERVSPPRITVLWNGQLIHEDVALPRPTGSAAKHPETVGPANLAIGPLRLQSHASAAIGPVRFRNVWVAPLETTTHRPGPWESLFDGETLDGWRPLGGEADFAVEDGVLVGTARPDTPKTFLCHQRTFADFELELEARIDLKLNSGVQFRTEAIPDAQTRNARIRGPQFELDPTPRAWSGGLFGEGGRGWIAPLNANPAAREAFRPGEWNRLRIRAAGGRLETWVNDVPATVVLDDGTREGLIGLQVHVVRLEDGPLQARWRNIRVRPLHAVESP